MRHVDEKCWWYILRRHFDEKFWWDILMRHVEDILMRHFYEPFWGDILMGHFDETFWWDILMAILMGHFDETFWWDILIAGNGWKFVLNMSRLVIQLLNCTTGLSNLTQWVRHWLPSPCFPLFCQKIPPSLPHVSPTLSLMEMWTVWYSLFSESRCFFESSKSALSSQFQLHQSMICKSKVLKIVSTFSFNIIFFA